MFTVTFLFPGRFLFVYLFIQTEDLTADAAFLETTRPWELHMPQHIWEIDIRGNEVTEIGGQAAIWCDNVFLPGDLISVQWLSCFWLPHDISLQLSDRCFYSDGLEGAAYSLCSLMSCQGVTTHCEDEIRTVYTAAWTTATLLGGVKTNRPLCDIRLVIFTSTAEKTAL